MNQVIYAESAEADLLEAWLHIAKDSQSAADRVLDVIRDEARTLATQPLMGRKRPELGRGVRSWPTSTPFILFYLARSDGIVILRVQHHGRDFRKLSL